MIFQVLVLALVTRFTVVISSSSSSSEITTSENDNQISDSLCSNNEDKDNHFFSHPNLFYNSSMANDLEKYTRFFKGTEFAIIGTTPQMIYRIIIDGMNLTVNKDESHDNAYIEKSQAFLNKIYAGNLSQNELLVAKREQLNHIFGTEYFSTPSSSLKGKKQKIGSNGKELNIVYSVVFEALKNCGDVLSGQEAVAVARAYPQLFSIHYDFVAQIQDFSSFTAEDIKTCTDPGNNFSLFVFPAALKTLSIDALLEVLSQLDFELTVKEFRFLVDTRGGATELINSPKFSQNSLVAPLMKMFFLSEFDAASAVNCKDSESLVGCEAVDTAEVSISPPFIHQYLGNLLSADGVIFILNDKTISNKHVKNATLRFYVMIESHIGVLFMNLKNILVNISELSSSQDELTETLLNTSRIYLQQLNDAFSERERLLTALLKTPRVFKDFDFDLFKIPFDRLVRESFCCFSVDPTADYTLDVSIADDLEIYKMIWNYFHFYFSEELSLHYDISLVHEKYYNCESIVKKWAEQTKGTLRFKSGPTAQHFLVIVNSHSTNPFNPFYDQECNDLAELESLSKSIFESNLSYQLSQNNTKALWLRVRKCALVLINRIRNFNPDYFIYLISSVDVGPNLKEALETVGYLFTNELLESMILSDSGYELLKTNTHILSNLTDFSMFSAENVLELNLDLSGILRGLFTVSVDTLIGWLIHKNGLVNYPVTFLECVNPEYWDHEEFLIATALPLAQSLFTITLHNRKSSLLEHAGKFPEVLKSLKEKGVSVEDLMILVSKWTIAWEMNFRTFSLLLEEKELNPDLLVDSLIIVLSLEASIRSNIDVFLEGLGGASELVGSVKKWSVDVFGCEDRVKYLLDNFFSGTFSQKPYYCTLCAVIRSLYFKDTAINIISFRPEYIFEVKNELVPKSQMAFETLFTTFLQFERGDSYVWAIHALMVSNPTKMFDSKFLKAHSIPENIIQFSLQNGTIPLSTAVMIHRQKMILEARRQEIQQKILEARKQKN